MGKNGCQSSDKAKATKQQQELDKLVNEAQSADIEKIAPDCQSEVQKKEWHIPVEIREIIEDLSVTMSITPKLGLIATILLFNKGADCQSNEGTPATMFVSLEGEGGEFAVEISKQDLMYVYRGLKRLRG